MDGGSAEMQEQSFGNAEIQLLILLDTPPRLRGGLAIKAAGMTYS
jgi:hypothetical protein